MNLTVFTSLWLTPLLWRAQANSLLELPKRSLMRQRVHPTHTLRFAGTSSESFLILRIPLLPRTIAFSSQQ